jgi:uncharacterized membrane protein HdeD (DUF308 family)
MNDIQLVGIGALVLGFLLIIVPRLDELINSGEFLLGLLLFIAGLIMIIKFTEKKELTIKEAEAEVG